MRWLREPLVHFLLLGAAIFLVAAWFGDPTGGRAERIHLGRDDVEFLRQGFERTWRRPPTAAELAGLVEERVREEMTTREALALGLDRDDTIVRRRLRQKLEFLVEDAALVPPTDAELEAWLGANRERFRIEPRIRFEQVFLSRDRHGERLRSDAERLLAALRAGAPADRGALGDPHPLGSDTGELSAGEVAKLFGPDFARRVFELESGVWQGPVDSVHGAHLVLVRERVAGREPALGEVRDAVAREWAAERRSQARERFYRELRARYDVEIDVPLEAEGPDPAAAAAR